MIARRIAVRLVRCVGISGHVGRWTWTRLVVVLIAGLILALVNMFIKPLLIFLSLPALLLTLGLFLLVVNGFTIMIVSWLYSALEITSFGWAIVAGIIVSLVNYLVTRALEDL